MKDRPRFGGVVACGDLSARFWPRWNGHCPPSVELSAALDTAENQYAPSRQWEEQGVAASQPASARAQRYEKVAALPEREIEAYIASRELANRLA
jgi:hypothetical protein